MWLHKINYIAELATRYIVRAKTTVLAQNLYDYGNSFVD